MKSKFYAYAKEGTIAPYVEERYTANDWVYFGANNLFPDDMLHLVDNVVPLGRCVDMAAMFIAGKGIRFVDESGEEVPEAQARFQQWMADTTEEDFLYATARDLAVMDAKAWVVRRAFGGAVARIDHMDVTRFRSGQLKGGEIKNYYWSASWKDVGSTSSDDRFKPVALKPHKWGKKASKSVLYTRRYKQGRDYYGEPAWLAAVPDCQVWAKVAPFNGTQIDTGFSANVHLHTYVSADAKDLDDYDEDIEKAYAGSRGRGIFHTFGTTEEGEPKITVLPRANQAGELDLMRDAAEKVIVRAYGVPDILYRMDVVGGLSSTGNALKAAVEQFVKGFVEPKQQMITKDLVRMMNEEGIKVWNAEIKGLDLFAKETYTEKVVMGVLTRNELRESMGYEEMEGEDGDEIPGKAVAPAPAEPADGMEEEEPETPEDDGVL